MGLGARGKVRENRSICLSPSERRGETLLFNVTQLEVTKNTRFPVSFSSELIFFGSVPDRWQCQSLELYSDHGAVVLLPFCFESFIVKYMSYASFAVKSILFLCLINDHFDRLWQLAKNLSSLPFFFLTASVWEKQISWKHINLPYLFINWRNWLWLRLKLYIEGFKEMPLILNTEIIRCEMRS